MEYTTDNFTWACRQIERLSIFKRNGYPETVAEKEVIVRAFMKILRDQPKNEFEEDQGPDKGVVKVIVQPLSARQSGEQLIEAVIENSLWFPLPAQLRAMYEELNFNTGGK